MGATTFCEKVSANSAQEAFDRAVTDAQWEHGHGGYSGTIAEKDSFRMCEPTPEGMIPEEWMDVLLSREDHFSDDKWGPAACIDCGKGFYLFFGWASC